MSEYNLMNETQSQENRSKGVLKWLAGIMVVALLYCGLIAHSNSVALRGGSDVSAFDRFPEVQPVPDMNSPVTVNLRPDGQSNLGPEWEPGRIYPIPLNPTSPLPLWGGSHVPAVAKKIGRWSSGTHKCETCTSCYASRGATVTCPEATFCEAVYDGSHVICPKAAKCSATYDDTIADCVGATRCRAEFERAHVNCPKASCTTIDGATADCANR